MNAVTADIATTMMERRGGHYATLELQAGANQREIRAAYRRLARATHPDQHPDDAVMERRFKRIARAYEGLGDPARRQAHDERQTFGRFAQPGDRAGRLHASQGPRGYLLRRRDVERLVRTAPRRKRSAVMTGGSGLSDTTDQ